MKQSLATSPAAEYFIPTGFKLIRVVGEAPKFKKDIDTREAVFYSCYLSECYGANGKEPCEYLKEEHRYSLSTVKYMVNTGLEKRDVLKAIANEEEKEIKYLA